MCVCKGYRNFQIFIWLTAIYFKTDWPFCKLRCNFIIIWLPEYENHWPWALGHCIIDIYVSDRYIAGGQLYIMAIDD